MSDVVCAAALGLVIPVLVVSVCGRLWNHGRSALRGRKNRDGNFFTLGFALQLISLVAACYGFNRVASSMKTEPEPFDPYEILELPSRSSNVTVIRSQYRRLSLKHHPDKNPGNRSAAEARFNLVAKAYQALSDPVARRNWEMHGHPDGYQPWTFDLPLPAWLLPGRNCDNATLTLYVAGYLVLIVGFVFGARVGLDLLDPTSRRRKAELEITEEDVKALYNTLDEVSSTEDVLECLAACPRLCSEDRKALADEMEPITGPLRERLLARGAALLAPPQAHPASHKHPSRGRRGKRAEKAKKGSGGDGEGGLGEAQREGQAAPEGEVAEEFYTRGRQGEGNRQALRSQPEMLKVVLHNLVVLLSGLYREGAVGGAAVSSGDGDDGEESSSPHPTEPDEATGDAAGKAGGDGAGADSSSGTRGAEPGGDDLSSVDPSALIASRDRLAREHEVLFGLSEPLLDACLKLASRRGSPRLFATVVEAKAMLRRRLWSSDDPAALREQEREADVDLDAAVPRIKVERIVAETWGESQVAVGDMVTATVTIVREHASEYRGFRRRRPVDGFLSRGEPWWVMLAAGKNEESLVGATPMLVENLGSETAECKIKFPAPRRPGIVHLTATVKSPVFVGVDRGGGVSLRVYKHEELTDDEDAGDW